MYISVCIEIYIVLYCVDAGFEIRTSADRNAAIGCTQLHVHTGKMHFLSFSVKVVRNKFDETRT